MQRDPTRIEKDIVLVGAGHAHAVVLRAFGMRPMPGVRLTLVTRQVHTPYSGMLPGLVTGQYTFDDVHIDTAPLSRFAQARLYQTEVTGIDLDRRLVIAKGRPPIPYDVLSIDIGSVPGGAQVPGVVEHAIPVKPIDRFLDRLDIAISRIRSRRGPTNVCVVGGGAAGVELALALDTRLRHEIGVAGGNPANLKVSIVSAAASILPTLPRNAQARVMRILGERKIEVIGGARVMGVTETAVHLDSGRHRPCDDVFWTTQARPADWLATVGFALTGDGFISVAPTLQSLSHDGVFAAGDVASVDGYSLPKSGVYAVRQGPILAENLRRAVQGRALERYRPQSDALYLISTGAPYAVGVRNGLSLEGGWVWFWKDWIDRSFMRKFRELPAMGGDKATPLPTVGAAPAAHELPADPMRCGGCGAKVGAGTLSRALGAITPLRRADVIVGLDAPDDAAIVDMGGPRLTVETVDYFRAFIDDPYVFGRIAANHALGDIYAMGAEPQTAMAIATLPYGRDDKVEADLRDLMTGANETLTAAGCALVGGHTSEGAEMALGFSVTGLVDRRSVVHKSGLKPGDALILTKPIGTGTVLAADMRGKAKARWLMAALAHMMVSNQAAARTIRTFSPTAVTDVTGFGLAGHLIEMLKASAVAATLDVGAVPLLDGAVETVTLGIVSSLHAQNVRARNLIRDPDHKIAQPAAQLLFDPQTAGGLLAGVPAEQAAACVKALHDAGYARAAIIGHVCPMTDAQDLISLTSART